MVKTDTGTVLVQVAPADFLKEIDTSFKKGDQVEVVGAKQIRTEKRSWPARSRSATIHYLAGRQGHPGVGGLEGPEEVAG